MATNTLNAPMTDAEWQSHSLSTLTRHIVGTHHQFLREALPRLSARFAEARARTPDDTIAALGPVFAAMRAGQFYILTHPELKELVRQRMEDILLERNPTLLDIL